MPDQHQAHARLRQHPVDVEVRILRNDHGRLARQPDGAVVVTFLHAQLRQLLQHFELDMQIAAFRQQRPHRLELRQGFRRPAAALPGHAAVEPQPDQ
ncbi:hypothetical protein [Streptomyces sp. NBC_00009]|uniref:hypothetical protein n=1 Tax=Streptomyces sp. NBC_00009 TaxID=2975620 RepID=UPI00325505CB